MLGLKLRTDPRWVTLVASNIEEILTDHAWCEQKAANSCISLIQKYNDKGYYILSLRNIKSGEELTINYEDFEVKRKELK